MKSLLLIISIFLTSFSQIIAISYHDADDPDTRLKDYVQECLADGGLNIRILGISRIDDLDEDSFKNLKSIVEDKRNCFAACLFQKRGIIDNDGKLAQNIPRPDPKKNLTTTYDDAVNSCRALNNFCRLGGCLYDLYF